MQAESGIKWEDLGCKGEGSFPLQMQKALQMQSNENRVFYARIKLETSKKHAACLMPYIRVLFTARGFNFVTIRVLQ